MIRVFKSGLLLLVLSTAVLAEYTIEEVRKSGPKRSAHDQLIWIKTLQSKGRSVDAVAELRTLSQRDLSEPLRQAVNLEFARALLANERQQQTTQRDRKELDQLLDSLRQSHPESPTVLLLELEAELDPSDPAATERVLQTLNTAEERFASSASFWLEAGQLYSRMGRTRDVDRSMARLESISNRADPGDAQGAGPSGNDDVSQAREILDYVSRARTALAVNRADESMATLRDWGRHYPRSLQPRRMLLRVASSARRPDVLGSLEGELRELEGEHGQSWRQARVMRLIIEAESGDAEKLAEAAEMTSRWLSRYPGDVNAHASAALVAEAQGDFDAAIREYRNALRHGDRSLENTRSLLSLLLVTRRFEEAREWVEKLAPHEVFTPQLLSLSVQTHLALGSSQKAVELARQAVARSPLVGEHHAVLAQALQAAGGAEANEVLSELKLAVELGAGNPANWVAAISFHLRQPELQTLDVARLVNRLTALIHAYGDSLPENWEQILMGRCLESGGNAREAEPFYRAALQTDVSFASRLWIPKGAMVTREIRTQRPKLDDLRPMGKPVYQTLGLLRSWC